MNLKTHCIGGSRKAKASLPISAITCLKILPDLWFFKVWWCELFVG
jgi:hypothetical protein